MVFRVVFTLVAVVVTFAHPSPASTASIASKAWTPDRFINNQNPSTAIMSLDGSITDSSNNVLTLYTEMNLPGGIYERYICIVKYSPTGVQLGQRCNFFSVGGGWELLSWIPDGQDGGYTSFRSSFGVTVVRINSSLNVVWQETDNQLSSDSNRPNLTRTSDGDVVVVGNGSGVNYDRVYGAKLSRATGSAVWSYSWQDNVRPQSILAFVGINSKLTAGPSGDVYIFSTGNVVGSGYRGQHITSTGVKTWGSNGISYPTSEPTSAVQTAATDSDGLPITTIIRQLGLYVQKYDASGALLWGSLGTLVTGSIDPNNGTSESPQLRSFPGGGVIIGIVEVPLTLKVYRVSRTGMLVWSQGATLTTTVSAVLFNSFALDVDSSGGALLSWSDNRTNPNCSNSQTCEVYAQRVNRCGGIDWDVGGFRVAVGSVYKTVASDGGTGAYVSWGGSGNTVSTQRIDGPASTSECASQGNFTVYDGVLQIRNNSDTLELGNAGRDIASTGAIYLNPFFSPTALSFFTVDNASGTQRLVLDAASSGVNALTARAANDANSSFYAEQNATGLAGSFFGDVLVSGVTTVGGVVTIGGVVTVGGSKNAKLQTSRGDTYFHAIESPDVRFEDFGRASTRHGRATITLDPTFLETVTGEYSVELTAEGKLARLAVTKQTAKSFTVTSDVDTSFSYRVSALRKGYAEQRFSLRPPQP